MTKANTSKGNVKIVIIAICAVALIVGGIVAAVLLGGGGAADGATLTSVEATSNNELVFVMSNGVRINAGTLPDNVEGIEIDGASLINSAEVADKLKIRITCIDNNGADYQLVRSVPVFGESCSLRNAMINSDGRLILYTSSGEVDAGKLLYPSIPKTPLTPSGASEYLSDRDVSLRNTAEVEIAVAGYGKITVLLDATSAPRSVEKFLTLAKAGSYNGMAFNTITDSFICSAKPESDTVYGEYSGNGYYDGDISHKRGTIALWHDNGSQSTGEFFICTSDDQSLDGKYATFGYVISGMNIVDEIASLTATFSFYDGMPSSSAASLEMKQAKIESVTVIRDIIP